jgi:gamma-glutamyl phosphate reductase
MNELSDLNWEGTTQRLRRAAPALAQLTLEQRHQALQHLLEGLEQQSDALLGKWRFPKPFKTG